MSPLIRYSRLRKKSVRPILQENKAALVKGTNLEAKDICSRVALRKSLEVDFSADPRKITFVRPHSCAQELPEDDPSTPSDEGKPHFCLELLTTKRQPETRRKQA